MERLYLYQSKTNGFIKNLWLLAAFLVFALQANAQCPPGDVELHSQYDLQQFSIQYPNCTQIAGALQLGHPNADYDLTNNSIDLYLSNIQSVGGLKIYRTNLTSLYGLASLTSINGVLDIKGNNYLSNITILANVNPNGITHLNIQNNFSLFNCHISTICTYLQGPGSRNISGNVSGCQSEAAVTTACIPACAAPSSVASSGITPKKATLSWTSSGSTFDLEWGVSGFTQGIGTAQNGVSGPSYQLTGLTPSTTYDVYVRQNCTANQSGWVKHTFTTAEACPTGTVYLNTQADVDNFGINYPDCVSLNYNLVLGNNGPNDIHDLSPLSGIENLYGELHIYHTQLTHLDDLNLSVISYRLQLSNNNLLTDISALQDVGGNLFNLTISGNPNLSNCNISRVCAALNNSSVDKTIQGNGTGCQDYNAVYAACYPCSVEPSNVTATGIISDSATVNWTSTGFSFDLEWGVEGFMQGTGTAQNGVTALHYGLTGLSPTTSYDVYVRRNCGSTQSNWVKHTFSTIPTCPSGAVQLTSQAAVDNFAATYPNCTQIAGQLKLGTDLSTPNDIDNLSPLGNLQSIGVDLIIYNTQLTHLNGLSAVTSISGALDISKNSQLSDISGLQQINPTGITHLYIEQNANLAACDIAPVCGYLQSSGDKLIFGNATGCESANAIVFSCIPACEVPANITSSSIVSDKARINWTNSGTFDLEWGTAGFTQGTGSSENGVSALNYTLTNLSESTTYDVYVRQNCTANQSGWVKHTFSTISTCPSGNVLLRSQQEVNTFGAMYPNCAQLAGAMTINNLDNISNLEPLSNITSIGGHLVLNNTYSGLHGLSSLTSIGGYLTISSNHNLYNLDQLSSLTSIGGDLQIQSNAQLNDISGLQHISSISNLRITNNPSLSVCNIESVCNYLNGVGYYFSLITGNAQGCENKDTVKALCPAAPQLECPTGNITLSSQYEVYEFALYNCTQVTGNLYIDGSVTDLSPLGSIASITGDLSISSTTQLANLNGLSSLTSIGGGLYINYNSQLLTHLNALSSLTSIGGVLSIQGNPQLNNISGLKNVSGITELYILLNPMLSSCSIASICSHVQGGGYTYLYNNGANCGDTVAIVANCPLPCQGPANLSSSRVSYKAARINWESESGSHSLEYGEQGFVQGTGTLVEGITSPHYDLTNLSETTTYDVYIKRHCDVNEADWVKYTFTTRKICPEIDNSFYFYNQQEVDEFGYMYPDCTQILGFMGAIGTGITNLSALSNIQNVLWGIDIQNTSLTSLDDLSSLTSVGGSYLSSSFNAHFSISDNALLTDISILDNIAPDNFNRINIIDNPSLEICNYPIICNYLATEGKTLRVRGNAEGCENLIRLHHTCGYECPPSSLEFSTQEEVNSFAAYFSQCTHINGSLTILDGAEDLTPLSNIESIEGALHIGGTPLTHLNDLSSLASIGGLGLAYNDLLNDVSALENVTINPGGGLYIAGNPSLTVCGIGSICTHLQQGTGYKEILDNAPGCEDLLTVYAACGITLDCPIGNVELLSQQAIADFAAMYPNCTQIEGNLIIGSPETDGVIDLSPLSNLEDIGGILLIQESQLTHLNDLSSLTSIGGFGLGNNPLLNDISALDDVAIHPEGGVFISGNPSLSVCGIGSICAYLQQGAGPRSINSNALGCEDETAVTASCPLPECPYGDVELYSQQAIADFATMYPNCTQIQGYLDLYAASEITDLSPLSNIESVGGMLYIDGIQATNLNSLSALTSIGGLGLWSNPHLNDLSALEHVLIDLDGEMYIIDNPSLSACGISSICTFLQGTGAREIYNNATGCESEATAVAACDLSGNCDDFTVWNGTSWSNGTPDEHKRAVIKGNLTITQNMLACEILLKSGVLTVNPGATLTVNAAIENTQTAANLIVESDANLIQLDDAENIGSITVKRNSFALYRQDYTLWSSPVAGQNLRAFSPATLFNRFSSYDTSLGVNGEYIQEIFTTADMDTKNFIDAKGYMIRMPNNWPVFVNEATPGTVYPGVFKGTPHNGNIAIPLSSANTGLNLVGNPYPSNISIESLFDANPDIQRVLYFWRKRNDVAGSGYATYTSLGLTSLNPEIDGLDLQNTIKPGQGFFVQANSATLLQFDNQMRTSGQDGHFLRSGNTAAKHRFWLNLSVNNEVLGQTLIGYASGATLGADNGIDAAYFNDSALALTSLIDDEEYVIQGRSLPFADSDVVPLGFKSDVAGNFTISLSNFDGLFADDQAIYLKDNVAGTLHNLKMAAYSFTSATGVFNDRFEVQYSSALGTNNPVGAHHAILIGVKNQNIQIHAGSIVMEEVQLIDMMGRIIYTQGAINATSALLENVPSSNQVLIVRISTKEDGIVTQKIIL